MLKAIFRSAKFRLFIIFILSLLFTAFSFAPSFYELSRKDLIPKDRQFVLEHNYMFDYNFYLSRIRQGLEGRWLVTEKYYNQAHPASLFQLIYLYFGKLGGVFSLDPPEIYHISRFLLGFLLLLVTGLYLDKNLPGFWGVLGFIFSVICGSWPILVKSGESYRFATYFGWWSASDSLQRITFLPHVLFGQIFMIIFIMVYTKGLKGGIIEKIFWGLLGLFVGVVFPPVLLVVYTFFAVQTLGEFIFNPKFTKTVFRNYIYEKFISRLIFALLSAPSLLYMRHMFGIQPWKALALFDIEHRMGINYREYALGLGPILPLGMIGLLLAAILRNKNLLVFISWIISIFILFAVFEKVPEQSPLRFTEASLHVPLGILAAYLFMFLWNKVKEKGRQIKLVSRGLIITLITLITITGILVMASMVLWLSDQARWRGEATWAVPIGAQLAYPLKDFMDAVDYIKNHTKTDEIVFGYVTAGNFIPAYAGNYVYLGHANTPDEDEKEPIARDYFAGKMGELNSKSFLVQENISYVFWGPQEREVGGNFDLNTYKYLKAVYKNGNVTIFEVEK